MKAWRETPTLTGRHVTLRPLQRDDRAAILTAFAEGLHGSFSTMVPTESTIDGWFDHLETERLAGRAIPFTALDVHGKVSGVTRFMRMAPTHRRLEIGGTVLARHAQRTGLNTDAKRLLLGHAFDTLECLCVQLRTDFLNQQSRRAIERLGARQDGILRGHLVLGEHRRDTVVYSILAHEWPGVRRNLDARLTEREDQA